VELLWDDIDAPGGEDTPKVFTPRPYQTDCAIAVEEALRERSSCFIVMATGCGKTEVGVLLWERVCKKEGILVITPRIELVDQCAERFRSRGVECGVERAHYRSYEKVTIASYDTIIKQKRYEKFFGVRLVLVDESHLNFTPAAIRMLEAFRLNGSKIVGMTATPRVGKKKSLSEFYGYCAFAYLYKQAVEEGWLCPCKIWLTVLHDLDLSKIPTSCGDYDAATLDRWLKQEGALQAVASLVEQTYEGKQSIVFARSISHAELLCDILRRRGILCSVVHSDTNRLPEEERRRNLDDFESKRTQVIVNVEVLTLGWDCPDVEKIYVARPTQSMDLYGQIVGRATRALKGTVDGLKTSTERRAAIAASAKPHFEIFDLCDASRHNKLITAADFLHPGMEPKLQTRVRDRQIRQGGCIDIDMMIEQERKALAQEQAALDMLEMSRRSRVNADGQFSFFERDGFADVERQDRRGRAYTVMLWGKYKRQPFHKVPTHYLRWTLDNCKSPNNHPGYFPAIRSELARRLTGMK
jgi:superfamily II DNA or RNA helicase